MSFVLKKQQRRQYNDLAHATVVAIDESDLALNRELFGTFDSVVPGPDAPQRPLLCCLGDALSEWSVVFSGTSFSHAQFDEAVVSNVAGEQRIPGFSFMTKMNTAANVVEMMQRFKITTSSIPDDTLELLVGRCRIVANAITNLILSAILRSQMRTQLSWPRFDTPKISWRIK